MSRRLFITRHLSADDPLRKRLEEKGFDVSGHSMLRFEVLKMKALAPTDWLFAYSPRGVNLFLEQKLGVRKENRLHGPKGALKIGAVGSGTAEAWEAAGVHVDFIGDGEPGSTAAAFANTHCANTKPNVTFLQAANSRRSVEQKLKEHVVAQRLSVYRSTIDDSVKIPVAEVYYLTSPLSAEAVLRQVDPSRAFDIWCVGSVTAGQVRKLGFQVQRIRPLV